MNTMEDVVKIQAQVLSDDACQFIIDRPVYPDGAVYFGNKETAHGSPLVEKLFELGAVASVVVTESVVKVTKVGHDDWLPIAKQIGTIIRTQLQSGESPISETIKEKLPPEDLIRGKIHHLFETQINPAVAAHGGTVDLIDVKGNIVYLRFGGGCQGCGMATLTLRQGIERAIRESVPEVGDILDVTDHEAGTNPYYAAKG